MDDDLLMLSGIQHFMYCPRQWALIHIEQQWADNALTTEGQLLHQRVDDPLARQLNNGVLTLRRMPLISRRLGLSGLSDAVECRAVAEGEQGATRFHGRGGGGASCPWSISTAAKKPMRLTMCSCARNAWPLRR